MAENLEKRAYQVRRGRPEDFSDMLDFGNYVFGIDFKALLPKLYENKEKLAADHVLVTEEHPGKPGEERIRAMVGCFKIPLAVGEKELLIRGIGTVSVHPYDRGKGYMKTAMHRCIEDAKAEGADLMVLSGRKQRYQHYGFEKCAMNYTFEVNKAVAEQLRKYGVEGICGKIDTGCYAVLSAADGKGYMDQCAALYAAQPVHAIRENFDEIARSWSSEVRVILKNGEFLGYATVSKAYGPCMINEFHLIDWSDPIPVILALFDAASTDNAHIIAQPDQKELIHALTLIAEHGSCATCYGINVLNYPAVIEAFLQRKADETPLPEGRYLIEVIGQGKTEILLADGKVTTRAIDTDEEADIALSFLQVMDFLFAPTGTFGVTGKQPVLEKAWLPIPVYFSEQDNV